MNVKRYAQLVGLIAVLGVGVLSVGIFVRDMFRGVNSQKKAMEALFEEARTKQYPIEIKVSQSAAETKLPKSFMEAYKIERTRLGQVQSLTRSSRGGETHPGFDSKDRSKVEARAKSLLKELSPSLGIKSENLKVAAVNVSEYSAQVFFQQTEDGVELAPYGSLSMDFMQDGSMNRLDSSLLIPTEVTNQVKYSAAQVKTLQNLKTNPKNVLWASHPTSDTGSVPLKQAYEFHEGGFQIVVDAETGQVIYKRDRRIN